MTKTMILKRRRGGWDDSGALDNALREIVGKTGSVMKQARWFGIAGKIEAAREPLLEQADELLETMQGLDAKDDKEKVTETTEKITALLDEIPVELTNKDARLLWNKLLDLDPSAFGRAVGTDGRQKNIVPTLGLLVGFFADMAEAFGKVTPWADDDEEDEEDEEEDE